MAQTSRRPLLVSRGRRLPPPRPGVRHVRLPLLGILIADDPLRRRVDGFFHVPMIILALLILPLLVVDYLFLYDHPEREYSLLWWICCIASSIIWLAFLVEFVLKVTIAESRFEYARRNWIDIVIIMLPFLRPFRAARLARTSRLFRLRGVGMKFARHGLTVLLGLQVTERMLGRFGVKLGPSGKDPRDMTRYQLMDEVKTMRKAVDAWESWYAAHQQYLAETGGEPMPPPPVESAREQSAEGEEQTTAEKRDGPSVPRPRDAAHAADGA